MKKIKEYLFADKRTFAKGLCKEKLFFIFVIGCIFGCIYEEILTIIFQYTTTGTFEWVTRRGLIYGELSPVYGYGTVIVIYLLVRRERKWYENYLYGALIGGGFEYFASFIQEKLTGTISWDYSNEVLNIAGRTTIPFMLFWGLLALLFIYVIYPFISNLIEKIPYNLGVIIYYTLLVLILLDMVITYAAALRQAARRAGKAPLTAIGKFFDKIYPDERLKWVFNNAIIK